MARYNPIDYQGPAREYRPHIGQAAQETIRTASTGGKGYADLDYLKKLLDQIITVTSSVYSFCESRLAQYTLGIEAGSDLEKAQQQAYPGSDVPNYITFDEYKYLFTINSSNAVQYVLSAYEDALRSITGTNALDVSRMVIIINNEAKRIKDFIDGYIGELDDTSEYRTVELFQDWAENATTAIEKLRTTLTTPSGAGLPPEELAQTDSQGAVELQTLFQVKVNAVAQNTRNQIAQFIKNWEETSSAFYSRNLGPALKFQLKVGRNINGKFDVNTAPVIANEVAATMTGLDANFEVALSDQLKRNVMFDNMTNMVFLNLQTLDTYRLYQRQLSQIGKPLKKIFINSGSKEVDSAVANADPLNGAATSNMNDNFLPNHSELTGLDDDDAHPQYLLRSGGIVTGDIDLDEDVRVGGIIPGKHKHTGLDGSEKISGSDIEFGSVTDGVIDTSNATTSVPKNLAIAGQLPLVDPIGVTTITIQVSFDVDSTNNISGYEFEITEL